MNVLSTMASFVIHLLRAPTPRDHSNVNANLVLSETDTNVKTSMSALRGWITTAGRMRRVLTSSDHISVPAHLDFLETEVYASVSEVLLD